MQNLLSENAWILEFASYLYEIFNGSSFLELLYEFEKVQGKYIIKKMPKKMLRISDIRFFKNK